MNEIGLLCGPSPCRAGAGGPGPRRKRGGRAAGAAGGPLEGFGRPATKKPKKFKIVVDSPKTPAYIRLTNDGGHAAGDKELRLRVSRKLDEIKRAA